MMNIDYEYIQYLKAIKQYTKYKSDSESCFDFRYYSYADSVKIQSLMPGLNKDLFKNEFLHVEAILKWILNNITHYGYNDMEISYNILDIFKNHMETGVGASCMMLAFALRDILEVYGYKARIVQGCPFDPKILDSHWLVHWYNTSLGKWVMLDPTWGAYCMKNDIPLSIGEIRGMLANGTKFDMRIQANISGSFYHFLLCRYFFHFNSFCYNGFNMFEREGQYRINLSPVGFNAREYFERRYQLEEQNIKDWMKKYVIRYNQNTVYTNDENRFWTGIDER